MRNKTMKRKLSSNIPCLVPWSVIASVAVLIYLTVLSATGHRSRILAAAVTALAIILMVIFIEKKHSEYEKIRTAIKGKTKRA